MYINPALAGIDPRINVHVGPIALRGKAADVDVRGPRFDSHWCRISFFFSKFLLCFGITSFFGGFTTINTEYLLILVLIYTENLVPVLFLLYSGCKGSVVYSCQAVS